MDSGSVSLRGPHLSRFRRPLSRAMLVVLFYFFFFFLTWPGSCEQKYSGKPVCCGLSLAPWGFSPGSLTPCSPAPKDVKITDSRQAKNTSASLGSLARLPPSRSSSVVPSQGCATLWAEAPLAWTSPTRFPLPVPSRPSCCSLGKASPPRDSFCFFLGRLGHALSPPYPPLTPSSGTPTKPRTPGASRPGTARFLQARLPPGALQ